MASYAKEMLLQCMAKSMDVLEGILDGYLSMSSDLIRTAKPLGPQPSIYGHLKGTCYVADLTDKFFEMLTSSFCRIHFGTRIRRVCPRWRV